MEPREVIASRLPRPHPDYESELQQAERFATAEQVLDGLAAEGWSVARLERAGTWCDGIKQFVPVAQEVECDACVPVWRVAAGERAGEAE